MLQCLQKKKSTNDIVSEYAKIGSNENLANSSFLIRSSHYTSTRKIINLNNEPNRFFVTHPSVMEKISKETGAHITSGGKYYPDSTLVSQDIPSLYIDVNGDTPEVTEEAFKQIKEILSTDPLILRKPTRYNLTDEEYMMYLKKKAEAGIKIPIDIVSGLKVSISGKIHGTSSEYLKHIQTVTDCEIKVKGRGSGYYDRRFGGEEDTQMYLHILGTSEDQLMAAREMSIELIRCVQQDIKEMEVKMVSQLPTKKRKGVKNNKKRKRTNTGKNEEQ